MLCYRHPSQSTDELNEYMISLNIIYGRIKDEKPLAVVLAGDFNARSPLFWENDIENNEDRAFGDFVITNNLEELINEPTHLRDDGSQSCIDQICTDQPFMFTESGVLPSLDAHSKHQIVHGTLNINVPCPPPYKRKVWGYKSANSDNIRREINTTDWANLFQNRNVNEMTETFTDVFLNIISRNISNKIVTVDDKDAPWITHEIKTAIKRNSRVYKKWVKRGSKSHERNHVREIQNLTNKLIRKAKTSYYEKIGNKLCDPKLDRKHTGLHLKK